MGFSLGGEPFEERARFRLVEGEERFDPVPRRVESRHDGDDPLTALGEQPGDRVRLEQRQIAGDDQPSRARVSVERAEQPGEGAAEAVAVGNALDLCGAMECERWIADQGDAFEGAGRQRMKDVEGPLEQWAAAHLEQRFVSSHSPAVAADQDAGAYRPHHDRTVAATLGAMRQETTLEPRTSDWISYREFVRGRAHGVEGDVRVLPEVEGPEPGRRRHLLVYLPPSYAAGAAAGRRYPVIYAQDGQNLFDERTSYAGDWHVDETMERLARERGIEAVVVGIPNAGADRLHEYSPIVEPGLSAGRADAYLDFLVRRVKSLVEAEFAVAPERERTGILGSSLGGLFSLYAFFGRPEVFGFVAAMSPSLQLGEDAMLAYLKARPYVPGRIYLDVGTNEGARPRLGRFLFRRFARPYPARVRAAFRILARKGYRPGHDLLFVQDRHGRHNEADWGRRLPRALEFLLAPVRPAVIP